MHLALQLDLPDGLAIRAAHCEGQRPQTTAGYLLPALVAVAERPFVEPLQRLGDLVQGLCLHLQQGELDIVLDVGFGILGVVPDIVQRRRGTLRPHVPHLVLNLADDLEASRLQNALELIVASLVHPILRLRPHDDGSFRHYSKQTACRCPNRSRLRRRFPVRRPTGTTPNLQLFDRGNRERKEQPQRMPGPPVSRASLTSGRQPAVGAVTYP